MDNPRVPSTDLILQPFLDTEQKGDQDRIDLMRYWRAILKYKWAILLVTVLAGIVAAIHAYSQEPVYGAKATLLIEPKESSRFAPVADPVASSSYQVYRAYQYFNTQKAVLNSRNFAEKIVDNLKLWEHPEIASPGQSKSRAALQIDWQQWLPDWLSWLGTSPANPGPETEKPAVDQAVLRERATNWIQGGLTVAPVENTQLMDISFRSSDPHLAAEIANAIAKVYIEHDLETRLETFKQATDWLTERTQSISDRLKTSETQLQQYREKEQLVGIAGGKSVTDQQLETTFGRLIAAQTERSDLQTLIGDIEDLKTKPALQVANNPTLLQRPSVKAAFTSTQAAQQSLDELSRRYGPKHPSMVSAQNALDDARAVLSTEISIVLDNAIKQFEVAKTKEVAIQKEFDELKGKSEDLSRKEFELHTLEKDVDADRKLYDLFVTRFKETNVVSDLETPSARIIEPARASFVPIWPNPRRTIGMATGGALAFGVMLALLLGFLDNTIKNGDELEERLVLNHLVTLPLLSHKEKLTPERFFTDSPNSSFAESVRTLRTGVLLSALDDPHKVVVITSTVPSEGKTTVAINLSLALSQLERVLLIDADMRRASIGRHFGIAFDTPGLSNLVAGSAEEDASIFQVENTNLHILPAGLIPPNPQELLSSKRFADLLLDLSEQYDRIVIDTAPTLAVSDALLVSTHASAIIFVVKADSTPFQLAKSAVKRLRQADAPIIGAVLNQFNARKAKNYGYYYGRYYKKYYHSYYSQEGQAEKA